MAHFVAATDFSSRSMRALRRAGILAAQHEADLTIVHVVDDDQPKAKVDRERSESGKFLDEQIASLAELRGVRSRSLTATGEAFLGVLRTAEEVSAELIVMGSHRKHLLRDVFVGTTLERVIRTGPYPILMVNKAAERAYGRVLVAVDMSESSAKALKTAKALGLLDGVDVRVLHVFQAANKGPLVVSDAPKTQVDQYIVAERRQVEDKLAAFLVTHGLGEGRWRLRVEEGAPFDGIERVVTAFQPDLLVIGTHDRPRLLTALIGSVAELVLSNLDVDILAVPPAR